MHSNAMQALAGNPISALKTSKAFTNYSHSLILYFLFPIVKQLVLGLGIGLRMGMGVKGTPSPKRCQYNPGGHQPKLLQ